MLIDYPFGRLSAEIADLPGLRCAICQPEAIEPALNDRMGHALLGILGRAGEAALVENEGVYAARFEQMGHAVALYREVGETDRAWCVAGLLVGFHKATDQEEIFYWERAPKRPPMLKRAFSVEDWRLMVVGPPSAPRLERIMGIIYGTLRSQLRQDPAKNYGCKKKDRIEPTARSTFASTLASISRSLNVPLPEVYGDRRYQGYQQGYGQQRAPE